MQFKAVEEQVTPQPAADPYQDVSAVTALPGRSRRRAQSGLHIGSQLRDLLEMSARLVTGGAVTGSTRLQAGGGPTGIGGDAPLAAAAMRAGLIHE